MRSTVLDPSDMPRLGLFWFVRDRTGEAQFISLSRPWDEVAMEGGFRTLNEGHYQVWRDITRNHAHLRGYEYEEFPRGRVNWVEEGDRWLLLVDPVLMHPAFCSAVIDEFRLPREKLTLLTDSHYRSSERVNPPGGARS